MSPAGTVAVILVAVVVIAAVVAVAALRLRSRQLRHRFGPEYRRAVQQAGGRHAGERILRARQRRHATMRLRPLDQESHARFSARWREVQARFVEAPREAVTQAEQLVDDVASARGYPAGDFDQRVADLSVEHAELIDRYRAAHVVATDSASTDTEGLRQALVDHRELFTALAGGQSNQQHHLGAHTAAGSHADAEHESGHPTTPGAGAADTTEDATEAGSAQPQRTPSSGHTTSTVAAEPDPRPAKRR